MTIDEEGFKKAMEEQREKKARSAREVTNYMGADATVYDDIDVNRYNRIRRIRSSYL